MDWEIQLDFEPDHQVNITINFCFLTNTENMKWLYIAHCKPDAKPVGLNTGFNDGFNTMSMAGSIKWTVILKKSHKRA